jgi:modulator of FtsH protease HflC
MSPKLITLGVLAAAVFILASSSFYTVDEREQVVITRLGKVVGSAVQDAGLHMKTPFLDQVHRFTNMKIQSDPSKEDQIYTSDKKILLVDNYAIWQIVDPVEYLQAFPGGEYYAERRLAEVIFSALRQELGQHTQHEVVVLNRGAIMDTVAHICNRSMSSVGIRVVDVRIKRADLPQENARSVYRRMVAERHREATRYRSNGDRAAAEIRGQAERDAKITLARAVRGAETERGRGDSRAVEVYAQAYSRDVRFYEFSRALDAYGTAIDSGTVLVLSKKSPFLKHLFRGSK